jgi:hypothetical protein
VYVYVCINIEFKFIITAQNKQSPLEASGSCASANLKAGICMLTLYMSGQGQGASRGKGLTASDKLNVGPTILEKVTVGPTSFEKGNVGPTIFAKVTVGPTIFEKVTV